MGASADFNAVAIQKVSDYFLASFVIAVGCVLVLITHVVSYDILFGLGLSWPVTTIAAVLVFFGLALLWAPTILLVVVVVADLFSGRRNHRRTPIKAAPADNPETLILTASRPARKRRTAHARAA